MMAAERRRLSGDGTDADVAKAEKALVKAREVAATPWSQRAAGARAALRDADRAIGDHVAANYASLAAQANEQALAAAAIVDAALQGLIDAVTAREQVSRESTERWVKVASPRQGLVAESRCGRVIVEAEAVLGAGGEAPGLLPESHLPEGAEVVPPEVEGVGPWDTPPDIVGAPRMAR
jgi:hypothetical protein